MAAITPVSKAELRTALRARRSSLPAAEASRAASAIAARAWRLPQLARCRRFACYLAVRGEVDCAGIIAEAWRRGREVYLPVLTDSRLFFAPYRPDTSLVANRLGIPEPASRPGDRVSPREIATILAPLVAFDRAGNRLGAGGGYYDRSLHFLLGRQRYHRPHLIGLAYEFQRIGTLPADAWDVRLAAAVTDHDTYRFRA